MSESEFRVDHGSERIGIVAPRDGAVDGVRSRAIKRKEKYSASIFQLWPSRTLPRKVGIALRSARLRSSSKLTAALTRPPVPFSEAFVLTVG